MQVSEDQVRGRTVIGADGRAVGEIVAFTIDTDTWSLAALRLKVRSELAEELGIRRSLFRGSSVDLPVRLIQSVSDAVVLRVPAAELEPLVSGRPEHDQGG
jgi:sporulation protein YlmC with PRC-barrel domain